MKKKSNTMELQQIKGILTDIGGVLYVGDKEIPGAPEALNTLRAHYPLRLITNTTRTTPATMTRHMEKLGFHIEEGEMYTALAATKDYVQSKGYTVFPVLTDEAKTYFLDVCGESPDCVVIGDAHTNFNFEHINTAFRYLEKGAKLVSTSKSRYFKDSDGELTLGSGGFVTALEYAADTEAVIIGKPTASFFQIVADSMQLKPEEILMIGDDIESDIGGAQKVGFPTALVKTGKFKPSDLSQSTKPDIVLEDFTELVTYLGL